MICKRCATGADLITQLHDIDPSETTGMNDYRARDFISVARTLHNLCREHGGCDCQHGIRELPKEKSLEERLRKLIPSSEDSPHVLEGNADLKVRLNPLY